ncbi:hypothetical protein ONZ51_g793 [Trametes cubensis]|uniref:Uncharacterized protein n=1 Tax=Trametes cubensis TaxID=1111947 RepID=A0AAD7U2N9_9APHY|nr:hypothetical protein ONZ51_g793 [Trametes cubensis]
MPRIQSFLVYTLLSTFLSSGISGRDAGNTTCASTQLDWYTDVVGETPCATYQRLRQICNPDYRVPAFRPNTPGDNCNDQLGDVMLLQFNLVGIEHAMYEFDAATANAGIDAGNGAYTMYAATCGNPTNHTLPGDIQTAVCNREIKLDRNLYGLFWDTGAWFYAYTKDTMTKDFAVTNNNTFTHCNSTLQPTSSEGTTSTTPTSSLHSHSPSDALTGPSSTSTASSNSSTPIAPIIGGAVAGVLGGVALALLGFWLFRRSRRRQGPKPLDLSKEYSGRETPYEDNQQVAVVTPFSAASDASNSGYGGGKGPSEEFALLPRSLHNAEKFSGRWGSSLSLSSDAERHEDAGPVPALQRSVSGRLPPAYRRSWETSEAPGSDLDVPAYLPPPQSPREDMSSYATSSVAETLPQRPTYGRDVKVHPPS